MDKVAVLMLLATLMSLTSCTKMVYIPVESVKTEYRDIVKRDSIHLYDSIHVREKGDTVLIERFRSLYIDRFIRDSFLINDTVRIPYPVVEVKRETVYKTRWYEDVLIYTGAIALVVLFVYFARRKI